MEGWLEDCVLEVETVEFGVGSVEGRDDRQVGGRARKQSLHLQYCEITCKHGKTKTYF